jgi:hypothetical protein
MDIYLHYHYKPSWRAQGQFYLVVEIRLFLASEIGGGECSASRPGRFSPWEKASVTTLNKGLDGTQPVGTFCRREQSILPLLTQYNTTTTTSTTTNTDDDDNNVQIFSTFTLS